MEKGILREREQDTIVVFESIKKKNTTKDLTELEKRILSKYCLTQLDMDI